MQVEILEETKEFASIMFEKEKELELKFNEKYAQLERQHKVDRTYSKIAHRFLAVFYNKGAKLPPFSNNLSDDDINQLHAEVDKYANMAIDFEKILDAIHNNPTLYSEWERFMMFLRMAGE